jgi:hypothetical protein
MGNGIDTCCYKRDRIEDSRFENEASLRPQTNFISELFGLNKVVLDDVAELLKVFELETKAPNCYGGQIQIYLCSNRK